MEEIIKFRPHHFLCSLSFQGLGYSKEFTDNYQQIVGTLKKDEYQQIQVTYKDDDICSKCPHLIGSNLCASQTKVENLDNNHAFILELQDGQILSWAEAKSIIKEKMTLEKFHLACSGCEWKSLEICERALLKLIEPSYKEN